MRGNFHKLADQHNQNKTVIFSIILQTKKKQLDFKKTMLNKLLRVLGNGIFFNSGKNSLKILS